MKKATWIAACLLVTCTGQALAERDNYFGNNAPPNIKDSKPSLVTPPSTPIVNGAGETFATATPIAAVPYTDTGNTCSAANDYTPSCASSGAGDLVYTYTPAADQCVNLVMCNSSYDTMLHVYDAAFNEIACNDDFCGLQTTIENVALTGGAQYYFVVDGFSTACGDYELSIIECPPPCDVACPAGSYLENEPVCGSEYVDATNGGCNSDPAVFSNIPCDDGALTVCGEYGTYDFTGLSFRDTDWYQIVLTQATVLNVCVCGSQPTQLAIVDGTNGCAAFTIACGSVFGGPFEQVCCEVGVGPGTYWIFVATDGFAGIDCGSPYRLTVEGNLCPPVSVEPADWSKMKGLYR